MPCAGPLLAAEPMHPFDRGVLIVAAVFLALALWGILDGPRRREGERTWHRRLAVVAALLGGGYFVVAGLRFVNGFLFGSTIASRMGARLTPLDIARGAVDFLVPAALGFLAILAAYLAAWGVTTACRRRRLHALAGLTALLLFLGFFVVAVNGGLPGGGDRSRGGFFPDACTPGATEEFVGAATTILFPLVSIMLILALVRLFRTPAESEERPAAVARDLATGTFAAAFFLLRTTLIAIFVLRQAALLGPMLLRPLPVYFRDEFFRSPLTLAMAGLAVIAVGLGFPALRLRREREGEGAEAK